MPTPNRKVPRLPILAASLPAMSEDTTTAEGATERTNPILFSGIPCDFITTAKTAESESVKKAKKAAAQRRQNSARAVLSRNPFTTTSNLATRPMKDSKRTGQKKQRYATIGCRA